MVLHLAARGDVRNVIRLVDAWSEQGEPSAPARLAQARALLDLGLTDRAWIRLKDLIDAGEGGAEVHVLVGSVFLRRGWHRRARQELELAIAEDPDDAVAQALYRASIEAVAPPEPPRLDDLDDVAALLALAERYAASGAPLNAARALERVRQRDPANARAADLQWALDGDFSLGFGSLGAACDAWVPGPLLSEFTDEVEHTESGAHLADDLDDAPDPRGGFPALFRSNVHRSPTGGTPTAIGRVVVLDPDDEASDDTRSLDLSRADAASSDATDGRGDTEIQMVIRKGGATVRRRPAGRIHVDPAAAVPDDFDLGAWRREHGDDPPLEEEDDDRIVLTGRERDLVAPPEPAPTTDLELTDPAVATHETARNVSEPEVPAVPGDDFGAASYWLLTVGVLMWGGALVLLSALIYHFTR